MSDIKIQTTNDFKSDESAEPQMTAETYRFVMSWDNYPEAATGERQVKVGVHTRIPDFSVLNFKDGIRCFPAYGPTVLEQTEPRPGTGFCEGNHYGKKSKPKVGQAVIKERWQTQSSKEAWNENAERLHRKEVESLERTVYSAVPHICMVCRDMDPSKKACKLSEQSMASLCSLHNRHRGLIVTPAHKKQSPYRGSLRQKLDEFKKRNRPAKIWCVSTLPTINRNDGKFLRYDTSETGEPIRIYQDSDPRLVPEIVFSHDRTEDYSGYDECAFPDDWRMDLAESSGNDDIVFMDINDNSEIKRQCFEMPKPNWVSVTRTRRIFTGEFRTYYTQDKYNELHKVWHWDPVRTEEYPTLINVQTEEWFAKDIKREAKATGRSEDELRAENTILVKSRTVITKKDRKYYSAKREEEKQKRVMSGYLILKDVNEGVAMTSKHKWPIWSKKAVAPMVQVPVPVER
ncbi:MAG TPA: hypothetical protein VER35_01725 [Candidatus Limnocylindrales bacterium]|nr:hypothetical protein [Candidatus Limnocylindrales bacterium]